MSHPLSRIMVFVLLVLGVRPAFSAPPVLDETQLAARIDALFAARWKKEGVVPTPVIEDAAFIRRVFLDLAGRIPSIIEVRDFLDDDRRDKRRIWIDLLLRGIRKDAGDTFSSHLGAVWGEMIVPLGGADRNPGLSFNFQRWMSEQLREKVAYDEIVRRILTSGPGSSEGLTFFVANENKPDNLAAATARVFLGVKLECASCHDDRSGGHWSREQFWEFASFFSPGGSLELPGKKRTVAARFLDGKRPSDAKEATANGLAQWVTSASNPWFARAGANRVWAYLLGIGLVDPVDEFGAENAPSHPEILDLLAEQFIAHKFDLRYLLRAIVLTEVYQRSSVSTHPSQEKPRSFARMAVRGLSAAQLFDSLAEAMEYRSERGTPNPYADPSRRVTPRDDFVNRFHSQERAIETQTSILQALFLMNGSFTARAVSLEHNRTLQTIAEAVKIDTGRRLETLFLVALTRKPTEKERQRLTAYVEKGGPSGNAKKALADIFWVLLNSAEFRLNH